MKQLILVIALSLNLNAVMAQDSGKTKVKAEVDAITPTTEISEKVTEEETARAEATQTNDTVEFGDITGELKFKITCVLNADTRVIQLIEQEDKSVGVVYTKFGDTKTIALAKNLPSYADTVALKIKGNLEASNYTCTQEGQTAEKSMAPEEEEGVAPTTSQD